MSLVRSPSNVNLWRIPLALSIGSIALFGITVGVDYLDATGKFHLPVWFTMGGIDDARAILSAMLGCVSTVLALIFSVALLVLSMVATLFGPRLLYRFLRDWVTQFTIGLFMGTFVFLCLVFLVTHQDAHSTFVPQLSLITGWLLVVASFGFLVFYSHRIASSIQNPDLIARIVDDLAPAIAGWHTRSASIRSTEETNDEGVARAIEDGKKVVCAASGYLQTIDHEAIVAAASRADALVHVLFRPGQFVLRGEALASVSPAERAGEVAAVVAKRVVLGRHRLLTQDWEFGIAQIVEIAIRALSPAVNDTFTGVACVDWVGDALLLAGEAPPFDPSWHDGAGKLRLHVRPLRLERLVKMGFDQIRQAASDNPAVSIRILETIARVAPRMRDAAVRQALSAQADAVREAASAEITVKLDHDDVEAAWGRAMGALAAAGSPASASDKTAY
jgi:uncharacterized membrane protein